AQLAAGYAPQLRVAGSAVGAAPADIDEVARLHDGGPAGSLVLAGAVGLATAYPRVPFQGILNADGRAAVQQISTMCTEEMAVRFAFKSLDGYTTVPDAMELPEWRRVLDAVRLGRTAPAPPAMVYHSVGDELIPVTQGTALHRRWCDRGATVQFQGAVLGEHLAGLFAGAPLAVRYLDERFAGTAAPSTCGLVP
ncbi:MAG: lipase family protein, partial [Micromonosporaceae bacterium]